MSLWSRWFGRKPAAPPPAAAEPAVLRDEDDAWLEQLTAACGDGRRLDELASTDTVSHLANLWQRGHERLATEWIEKLVAVPEAPPAAVVTLRARLVDWLEARRELDRAVVHLQALTRVDAHATRANYLLAEHYRTIGDDRAALRHYEAVLAHDVDYPNVRVRVERLRAARGLAAPAAGETIAGADVVGVGAGARYRLVRELGRGATGVVYLARDAEFDRDVAVKLLHPHLAAAGRASAVERFFHEARLMASLRHPNVVAVLDLEERSRRLVLELAAGGTLRDVLRDRGPRTVRRAIERHLQLLSALDAAHRRGVVHRDVKPGNLMFRRDPDSPGVEIMLGDFGVAQLSDERPDAPRGEAVGTLAYMSPDQRRGAPPVPADDLYAAAVVLYEMLTGRHPWPREQLLSGERGPTDFRLPDDVLATAPPALAAALTAHLDRLGDPVTAHRPTTDAALGEAAALRTQAIAVGA